MIKAIITKKYLEILFFFKNYKNSINEDDKINKKSSYGFKDEKQILNTINQKIIENNINRKTKDRVKKIFPNLLIHNKK